MRKFLLIFFFTLFIFASPTLAQTPTPESEFNFTRAYQDYVFTYDQYRNKHSEYALSRSQFMQSRTLASQQKAQEATFAMLSARDEATKAHLTMVRMRLAEALGVPSDKRQVLQTRIDTEVAWYESHKATLSSAESLDDQIADSNIAKTRYERTTTPLVYESLTEIAIGKVSFLRSQQQSILTDLQAKLGEIRSNGDMATDDMERGLLEVQNRIGRSESKETEARKVVLDTKNQNFAGSINQVTTRAGEGLQYLKEANTYLQEIMRKIQYGN